jgi:hypothetical protein
MLALIAELPPPVAPEVRLVASEAALGAVSFGPLAPETTPSITIGVATRDLAADVLDQIATALAAPDAAVSSGRLLALWNACYSLDGGEFAAETDVDAWRLFGSIGGIALFIARAEPTSDLANALLGAAVTTIETNPSIAVPARCDLASPYEDLRAAMAHKRELLARLEKAVADAAGCTRGTYAPSQP